MSDADLTNMIHSQEICGVLAQVREFHPYRALGIVAEHAVDAAGDRFRRKFGSGSV
jgi:hypothetical protein